MKIETYENLEAVMSYSLDNAIQSGLKKSPETWKPIGKIVEGIIRKLPRPNG